MVSEWWLPRPARPVLPAPAAQAQSASDSRRERSVSILQILHSDNMDTSPLMQALRTEHGAHTDRGMSDVNTGDMTAVMSYDQVSYLLTVMVTVSVVSILILIFSVTLILGFLW